VRWICVGVVLIASILATPGAHADYVVVDLGVLPGGSVSTGAAINAGGLVTGAADSSGGMRAFLSSGGTPQNLGVLPGGSSSLGTGVERPGRRRGRCQHLDRGGARLLG
jgi:uncharacterized membrane protein